MPSLFALGAGGGAAAIVGIAAKKLVTKTATSVVQNAASIVVIDAAAVASPVVIGALSSVASGFSLSQALSSALHLFKNPLAWCAVFVAGFVGKVFIFKQKENPADHAIDDLSIEAKLNPINGELSSLNGVLEEVKTLNNSINAIQKKVLNDTRLVSNEGNKTILALKSLEELRKDLSSVEYLSQSKIDKCVKNATEQEGILNSAFSIAHQTEKTAEGYRTNASDFLSLILSQVKSVQSHLTRLNTSTLQINSSKAKTHSEQKKINSTLETIKREVGAIEGILSSKKYTQQVVGNIEDSETDIETTRTEINGRLITSQVIIKEIRSSIAQINATSWEENKSNKEDRGSYSFPDFSKMGVKEAVGAVVGATLVATVVAAVRRNVVDQHSETGMTDKNKTDKKQDLNAGHLMAEILSETKQKAIEILSAVNSTNPGWIEVFNGKVLSSQPASRAMTVDNHADHDGAAGGGASTPPRHTPVLTHFNLQLHTAIANFDTGIEGRLLKGFLVYRFQNKKEGPNNVWVLKKFEYQGKKAGTCFQITSFLSKDIKYYHDDNPSQLTDYCLLFMQNLKDKIVQCVADKSPGGLVYVVIKFAVMSQDVQDMGFYDAMACALTPKDCCNHTKSFFNGLKVIVFMKSRLGSDEDGVLEVQQLEDIQPENELLGITENIYKMTKGLDGEQFQIVQSDQNELLGEQFNLIEN